MIPRHWVFTDAPYAGGAERYLQWLLDAAGPQRLGVLGIAREGLSPWLSERKAAGFCIETLPASGRVGEWRGFATWCARRKPQVLHVNLPGPYDGLLATAPRLARLSSRATRVIVTEHLPSVGRVGKRYWWKRMGVGAVDVAIALCGAHATILRDTFGYRSERVRVIANGVPEPRPEESPASLVSGGTGGHLVQLGSLVERKGGLVLLDALAVLAPSGVCPDLWFVGEGPERSRWEARAKELGLAGRVHFVGHRPDPGSYLQAADGVVLASEREGMPLSLLEAMARGRPVIATDVDGVPEILDPSWGWLVPRHDAAALAAAIAELFSDAPARRAKGAAARARWSEAFRLEQMVAKTFETYGWEER